MGLWQLRLADSTSGELVIDGVNTATLSLETLRSRVALIPQESMMFEGDIRVNLDPLAKYADEALWAALNSVRRRRRTFF